MASGKGKYLSQKWREDLRVPRPSSAWAGSVVALTRASRPFGNFDGVALAVKKFEEAGPLPVPLNWTGVDAVGDQFVPDFFNFV
jgi:hypothetical protein